MQLQSSTKFAIQQLIQSLFTLSVLGTQKDIALLEQMIKEQNDPDEDKQILTENEALVPILNAVIGEIDRNDKRYSSWPRRNAPCQN
jgi:hypothetical protein